MEIEFPIEFIVPGTPVSFQAKRAASKTEWKHRVRNNSMTVLPEGHFATNSPISVTLYYFPAEPIDGDIDNIIKLVLDAMSQHIYQDDRQVERILVQKFEPNNIFRFAAPSLRARPRSLRGVS